MHHSIFIHSSADGHLGCFQILAIVNNVGMNTGVKICFQISVSGFLGYIPRTGIAGSKGSSIFSFLRKLHTVLHSGCTSLHSHQLGFPFLHILAGTYCLLIYWWQPFWQVWGEYLIVVLLCMFLMVSDIEHFFMSVRRLCVLFGEVSIQVPCPFFF